MSDLTRRIGHWVHLAFIISAVVVLAGAALGLLVKVGRTPEGAAVL